MLDKNLVNELSGFWKSFKNEKNRLIYVFWILFIFIVIGFLLFIHEQNKQTKLLFEKMMSLEKNYLQWNNINETWWDSFVQDAWSIDKSTQLHWVWNTLESTWNNQWILVWSSDIVNAWNNYVSWNMQKGEQIVMLSWDNKGNIISWTWHSIWNTQVKFTSYPTKPCGVKNWQWIQSWQWGEDWKYWNCEVISCDDWYHIEKWNCAYSIMKCNINWWNWKKEWDEIKGVRWKCIFQWCNEWYLETNDTCKYIGRYPWCDKNDIVIWSQIWAACNVWATISWNSPDSSAPNFAGGYYQRWKYDTSRTEKHPWNEKDRQIRNDDAWWDTSLSSTIIKWPCAKWYHVPSESEFILAIDKAWSLYKFRSKLNLPLAWIRHEKSQYDGKWLDWYYWTSTLDSECSKIFMIDSSAFRIWLRRDYGLSENCNGYQNRPSRLLWLNIRCIKD